MKYSLYDLEITVVGDQESFNCSHKVGDTLLVKGENLSFKAGTEQFSHYALATLMPYIAAKQRAKQKDDWMYYETDIACPDPKCGAIFRFRRMNEAQYSY
jgi:uncharacterized repeat protein (TIGR04076 family)